MQKLEVGSKIDRFKNHQEGVLFQMDDAGADLVIVFNNPTKKEVEDIKTGKLQFGLLVKKGIIFLLSKFGSMQWMDAPFHVALAPNLTKLQEVGEGQGYGCTITLIDGVNGEVKALRYISFNTQFSRRLKENIEEQSKHNFDNQEYGIKLLKVMNNYTTNDMVKYAEVTCRVK